MFFNVTCYEDLIYPYNSGQCFKADKVSTDRVEECYIDILEDGVLYVKDFWVRVIFLELVQKTTPSVKFVEFRHEFLKYNLSEFVFK